MLPLREQLSDTAAIAAGSLPAVAPVPKERACEARLPANGAMVTLRELRVRRGEADVLRGISLDIQAASVTAVVGCSGVGKTTLLSSLNGLLLPVSGTISIAGIGALDTAAALQEHRLRTATVF